MDDQVSKYDVVIIGGGPAGLSAALTLGRARKHVLLFDAGPRRNALAEHMHNFVTRDGVTPEAFRGVGREQLREYPTVAVRDARVDAITGSRGRFQISSGGDVVEARRVLLCTGLLDTALPLEGFRELWGHSIFQCPYCHGWERRDRPWGYLVRPEHAAHVVPFVLQLRSWTQDLQVFTQGDFELPAEAQRRLTAAGVRLETSRIERLVAHDRSLEAIELVGGARVRCEVLFVHPPQRQIELVTSLGLTLDSEGFVQVDPMSRETSVPGIFAAGDLTTRMQAAIVAASAGMQAAAMLNLELCLEA